MNENSIPVLTIGAMNDLYKTKGKDDNFCLPLPSARSSEGENDKF